MVRPRAGGDDELIGREQRLAPVGFVGFDGMGIDEPGAPADDRHVIAIVERAAHVDLAVDHAAGRTPQILKRDVQRHSRLVEQRVVIGLGHLENRVAQRLAGNGAAMGAETADVRSTFDDGHALAAFGGLHRGAFAAGPGAENHHVVMGCIHKRPAGGRIGSTLTRSLSPLGPSGKSGFGRRGRGVQIVRARV